MGGEKKRKKRLKSREAGHLISSLHPFGKTEATIHKAHQLGHARVHLPLKYDSLAAVVTGLQTLAIGPPSRGVIHLILSPGLQVYSG